MGAAIVLALIVVAILADVLSPQSPTEINQATTFERPSLAHPLGTDQITVLGFNLFGDGLRDAFDPRLK